MTLPHISEAILAEDSSESERKIRVLSVWTSVRQASVPDSTERSEEIDCVATIGMQRHCRVRANAFSSPARDRPAPRWRTPGTPSTHCPSRFQEVS